jgi:predicted transcriptional regulator
MDKLELIKQRIAELGLKKTYVAKECGISLQHFSRVINGKVPLNSTIEPKILKILNL